MSGGAFDYKQDDIRNITYQMEKVVHLESSAYTAATVEKFEDAVRTLRCAAEMVERIDWLLSGDDGEETFHKRWAAEVYPLSVEV